MFFYQFIILVDEKHKKNGESQDMGGELKFTGIIKYTYYQDDILNISDQGLFCSMEGDKETFVFSCSAVMHRLIMLEFTGNKY